MALFFEVPRWLAFGWIWFLAVVLPAVTVDWGVVAVGAAALLLFTGGVHWLAWAWRRAASGRPPWRFRWTLRVVALTFLLFASGVCLVGLTHQLVWLAGAREPLHGPALGRHFPGNSDAHLEDMARAAHNYHAATGHMPPGGTFAPNGTGLHSWETYLLSYGVWYDTRAIDLQSPWNGPPVLSGTF